MKEERVRRRGLIEKDSNLEKTTEMRESSKLDEESGERERGGGGEYVIREKRIGKRETGRNRKESPRDKDEGHKAYAEK